MVVHTFTLNSLCPLHKYRLVLCQTRVMFSSVLPARMREKWRHLARNSKYYTNFDISWILVSRQYIVNGVEKTVYFVYTAGTYHMYVIYMTKYEPLSEFFLKILGYQINVNIPNSCSSHYLFQKVSSHQKHWSKIFIHVIIVKLSRVRLYPINFISIF